MTKKKRNHPGVDEVLARPWCYYCERDFDDLKILINHQKAKHFKCERCGRRLNTAGGLSVHMSQVHKENLTAVDNALPNRVGLEIEIFGMEGIPEDIALQHQQRVLTQFHQAEAERRANNGNPGPGAAGGNPAKKPKTEDISDLKKRLAEHKAAKMAAENGGSSGSATPTGAGQIQAVGQQQATYQTGSPSYPQYQQAYAPPPSATTFGQPQSYAPAPVQPGYPAPGFPPQTAPGYNQSLPQPGLPQHLYAQPPQPSFQHAPSFPPQFSPPPFQAPGQYPVQPYSPHGQATMAGSFPVSHPAGHPRPFGVNSPVSQGSLLQRTHSPAQQSALPQRPSSGSLPTAPGLPQRPAVGAPPVNAFQFQQMHQGQISIPRNNIVSLAQRNGSPSLQNGNTAHQSPTSSEMPIAASIDDLISSASKQAEVDAAAAGTENAPPATVPSGTPVQAATITTTKGEPIVEEKSSKKDKEKEKEKAKQSRLVYSDNEISPEEKMAKLPKYAAFALQPKSLLV